MAKIHPLSIVEEGARLAEDVEVGPFCIVGPEVTLGAGCVLQSHVTIRGLTEIGARNKFYSGAAIGCEPQDKKYGGERTRLVIGDENVFRENTTVSTGTVQDEGITTIGSGNLLMVNVHVAHDCRVGSGCIFSNNVGLAGHVHVEDHVVIGGQSGVHQFVRIGERAMVGGASGVVRDVPPYVICSGHPCEPHGLNSVGLRRAGFTLEQMNVLKECYRAIYREGNLIADALAEIDGILERADESVRPYVEHMRKFVAESPRGIIR